MGQSPKDHLVENNSFNKTALYVNGKQGFFMKEHNLKESERGQPNIANKHFFKMVEGS